MKDATAPFAEVTALPVSVAILDPAARIVSVNETWKRFARRNGLRLPHYGVGANYFDFCPSHGTGSRRLRRNLRALLAGELDLLTFVYPCHSPDRQRWFSLLGFQLANGTTSGATLLHLDLSKMLPMPAAGRDGNRLIRNHRGMMTLDLRTFGTVERTASQALTEQFAAIFGAVDHHRRRNTGKERRPDPMAMARAKLSKRQLEVLRLIGEGKSNKEIAKLLARSPHTIKLHVSAILRQLDLKSRTQAALLSSGAATWPE